MDTCENFGLSETVSGLERGERVNGSNLLLWRCVKDQLEWVYVRSIEE